MDVVLSLPHARGVAAVCHVRGRLVAYAALEERGGKSPTGVALGMSRPWLEGIIGAMVVAGVLPVGAKRALVAGASEARSGGGAWLAVVPGLVHEPVVRFEAADGAIVPQPLPSGPHERVADADEPCPACGAVQWVHARAADLVVCLRCGHREGMPVFYAPDDGGDNRLAEGAEPVGGGSADVLAGSEADARPAGDGEPAVPAELARLRAERDAALRDVSMPVFVAEGASEPPTLSGTGWGRAGVTSVTVAHGTRLEITTDRERHTDPDADAQRALLVALPQHGEWPRRSPAALTLWLAARERESRARAAAAESRTLVLPVDGVPVMFTALRADEAWAAVGATGELHVTVVAHGIAPEAVRLRQLERPSNVLTR